MKIFWLATLIFCIVWYATMTLYVGIKGLFDIFSMLNSIRNSEQNSKIS
ncbi:MAG: hypothetical protein N3G21_04595 [Candidatus Hydrogenedentes bacterium]|nr:hypothetical protein [Candidatus Hydrogenedentota bacterium]